MKAPSRSLWIALIAIVAAFLLGFSWQYFRAAGLESELEQTREALALTRLEAALGTALIEAQQGNYELARQRASEFFTGLEQLEASGVQPPAEFTRIAAQRDPTITFLSRSNPESAAQLQRLYVQLRTGLTEARRE